MITLSNWLETFDTEITPLIRLADYKNVRIYVKRDDLNHPVIQGNKLRKLKYNIKHIIDNGYSSVATFGGAWSNHIVATAQAAQLTGLESLGFIRGDELKNNTDKWSNSLKKAEYYGMKLIFLSRKEYKHKQKSNTVIEYLAKFNQQPYIIPEGGSNKLALKGVAEIMHEISQQTNKSITHIITPCGTGGTTAGLITGISQLQWQTQVISIPVLKGAQFLQNDIKKMLDEDKQNNWQLYHNYHAGGYAKLDTKTREFGKDFSQKTKIPLDKIYTTKSFYAAYDLITKQKIKANSTLVILHTGGLQGGIV